MKFARENIKSIIPYVPVTSEGLTRLDANESPYNLKNVLSQNEKLSIFEVGINLYPTKSVLELKKAIGQFIGISEHNIMCGNGSDELLKIIFDTVIDNNDLVMSHSPTFSQYQTNAQINAAQYFEVPSNKNLMMDFDLFLEKVLQLQPKLIFLCNPNNPTGELIPRDFIVDVLKTSKGLVIVDEAYGEFSGQSVCDLINEYPNLVVLRTLSKAVGLAGARIGYLISNTENINMFSCAKMPYNLNSLSCALGVLALSKRDYLELSTKRIVEERNKMYQALSSYKALEFVPSQANFLFFNTDFKDAILERLLGEKIKVRSFSRTPLNRSIRITVGKPEINRKVITAIKEVLDAKG